MNEFEIIESFFNKGSNIHRKDVIKGIGDDAAIVEVPPNHQLAITTDTLVAGIHFFEDADPSSIGHKALAVSLSDLAAMGATPAWVTLAITMPSAKKSWLKSFCDGFFTLAQTYDVALVGGDLTRGPLTITVEAFGFLPKHQALLRSTATTDDIIYVTGTLGDAGCALQHLQHKLSIPKEHLSSMTDKLTRPQPRVNLGKKLLNIANAAIDISDGLIADLNHILVASHVGAVINIDQLPLSEGLKQAMAGGSNNNANDKAIALALTAGDDYELCFTVPHGKQNQLEAALATSSFHSQITAIGRITASSGLELKYANGDLYHGSIKGYLHF